MVRVFQDQRDDLGWGMHARGARPATIKPLPSLERSYRDVLCSRIHTRQSNGILPAAGRTALATPNHKETTS
jgi:hypothetical protein